MKNGYQQHFQKIQKVASKAPKKKVSIEDLRNKMRANAQVKKKSKKFPMGIVLSSLVGLLVAGAGLQYLTDIEKIVKKIEISFFGYALAADQAPPAESKPVAQSEKKEEPPKEEKQAKIEYTDEEINHFAKLNERKRELDAREEEMSRLEAELAAQKTELEKRLTELDKTRRDISSVLEEKVKADDKKVESLVSVYSTMKPQQAAKVFESMDEDLAIEILGRMKKKPAAEILNLVKSEKAQVLSEKYAGYKRK